jgi:hypothetical protein
MASKTFKGEVYLALIAGFERLGTTPRSPAARYKGTISGAWNPSIRRLASPPARVRKRAISAGMPPAIAK